MVKRYEQRTIREQSGTGVVLLATLAEKQCRSTLALDSNSPPLLVAVSSVLTKQNKSQP